MEFQRKMPSPGVWSPKGYCVVEVSGEAIPVIRVPPRVFASEPAPVPALPSGYRAVVVAEETVPRPTQMPRRRVRDIVRDIRRPPPKNNPLVLWGAIGAAGFFFMVFAMVAMAVLAARREPELPAVALNNVAFPQGIVAEPPRLVMPDPAADNDDVPARDPDRPPPVVAPGGALPCKDGCEVGRLGDRLADRENFGTAVGFARNSVEAARIAADERKLLFILHVSGNFEEARFT